MVRLPGPAPGRGVYRYSRDGADAGVQEFFVAVEGPHGIEVRSERRAAGGVELAVDVDHADGLTTCAVSFRSDAMAPVTTTFHLRDGIVEVHRTVAAEDAYGGPEPLAIAGDGVLSPVLRVFQGPAIAACLAAGGPLDVVLVDIADPDDETSLLAPVVQARRAERRGVEHVGGQPLRRCAYLGGNYDESADFWLDERDRLVRYRWVDPGGATWDVLLVEA
jgi:hypothetical protein